MRYSPQLTCFLVLFGTVTAFAQTFELGVMAGGAGYMGDLNPDKPLKISWISAGAYAKLNLDPYWAVGLHYTYGKIRANDAFSENADFKNRNINFKTPLNEVSVQVDFNFLNYFAGGGTKKFTPYIFTGIGGVFYSPKGTYDDTEYNLRYYQTEGQAATYRNYALTIPYGVGIKVQMKENWGLFSQIGYRTAHTDYLDDVSGVYPDAAVWPDDGSRALRQHLSNPSVIPNYGAPGTQRGDFRKRDTYMFVGIGISYTFVSQKCYTF
ncbi:DUF6089 family protein [Pedobacter heparinus]|uniref:DUF6089 domain-containing protein n=1 Tax=Pedobacter heparinus (strain ATCC 13125 / DSM 2366 / CIP 104194 / JCM 7457 / NBRC 12017 / NCIMB 9290 / NRRL B-14731 / HIM 762-3) TaxID=485917 RepID=C6Y2Z3_PEDHD|nr:DUF6089 family protein [Pedobacter heparinus]ACU03206.1 hypothetical protein Phep_0984 [Pedobacter heparinus DSM 2366]